MAIDVSGAAYVTGETDSTDFPTMNALQPQSGGGADAFVVKIAPEGGAMIYGLISAGLETSLAPASPWTPRERLMLPDLPAQPISPR
jgi:hypothetical protein